MQFEPFDTTVRAPSVLLVDDTPSNLLALGAVLAPLGARLVEARSGAEALARLEEEPFAAVLLDVQMPEMDGFEVARRMRELDRGRELPILFLTAIHRDELWARRGYEAGGADYVTKPFDPDVLRARVKAFVDLFAQREAVRRIEVAERTRERDEAMRRLVAHERIATATLDSKDLGELLHELLRIFTDATVAADSARIFLRDGDRLDVGAEIATGGRATGSAPSQRIGEGFAGRVAAARAPLELVVDASTGPAHDLGVAGARVLFGLPLLWEGELLGVAQVGSSTATSFTASDKRLFGSLAERAAWSVSRRLGRERIFEVLGGVPAAVAVLCAPSLEVEYANAACSALFGGASLTGKRAEQLELGPSVVGLARQVFTTGEAGGIDEVAVRFPIGRRVMRVTAHPLRNHAGSVDRVLACAVDVTAQVDAREELEVQRAERGVLLEREHAARAEAELASRAKDEFLATVSHELRTPLNAILGWAVMARTKASGDVERALGIIERNARAQSRMIEDVLDISRIVSGKLRLETGRIDFGAVVQAGVDSLRPAAEAKDVTLRVWLADLPPVRGDAERLQQIVANLVSNGIKFTPARGAVSVEACVEGDDILLRVEDSGEGIDPAFLPHVFEPFRQADGSSSRRHGGLGLGLAIVKQLVNAHGGLVRAESRGRGKGAAFVVTIPVAREEAFTPRPSSRPQGRVRLEGLRVLVVDDDEDARLLLGDLLTERGAEVVLAGSAQEGFAAFTRTRPDVLVSDIAMPGGDGYGLVRAVRALPPDRGGRTPAVAVTAHAREQDGERAFAAGFQSHLAKPVDVARLVTVVANLGGLSFPAASSSTSSIEAAPPSSGKLPGDGPPSDGASRRARAAP